MQDKYGNSVGGYVAGIATGGSATTLQDVTKNFSNDMFINEIVVFEVKGIQYSRVVTDNDANTLTFASAHAAEAAVCKIQVGGSIITVTAATAGEAGNANLAKVIEGSGDDALAAALSGQVLTVSLGMTDGASDDAENTATLVAAAIDGLAGFAATVTTGDGSDVVVVTPSGAYYRFSGGLNAMPVGTEYQIQQPEGANVQLSGSILEEQKIETDAVEGVVTFTNDIVTIEIFNTDDTNAGVFAVNGINLRVPASQVFKAKIGGTAGKTVTITGATTYIISTYV